MLGATGAHGPLYVHVRGHWGTWALISTCQGSLGQPEGSYKYMLGATGAHGPLYVHVRGNWGTWALISTCQGPLGQPEESYKYMLGATGGHGRSQMGQNSATVEYQISNHGFPIF